jgi:hypothetical protein
MLSSMVSSSRLSICININIHEWLCHGWCATFQIIQGTNYTSLYHQLKMIAIIYANIASIWYFIREYLLLTIILYRVHVVLSHFCTSMGLSLNIEWMNYQCIYNCLHPNYMLRVNQLLLNRFITWCIVNLFRYNYLKIRLTLTIDYIPLAIMLTCHSTITIKSIHIIILWYSISWLYNAEMKYIKFNELNWMSIPAIRLIHIFHWNMTSI